MLEPASTNREYVDLLHLLKRRALFVLNRRVPFLLMRSVLFISIEPFHFLSQYSDLRLHAYSCCAQIKLLQSYLLSWKSVRVATLLLLKGTSMLLRSKEYTGANDEAVRPGLSSRSSRNTDYGYTNSGRHP
jgi:hypothetical protein